MMLVIPSKAKTPFFIPGGGGEERVVVNRNENQTINTYSVLNILSFNCKNIRTCGHAFTEL